MSDARPWHRLFGLSLEDLFTGLPVRVELEKDLSLRQQLLDVVVIRTDAAPLPVRLPDGLEELAAHNLVTFKSHQEALDGWSLLELLGHYVNYRKQVSPTMRNLLPESDFRLFAVCVRSPQVVQAGRFRSPRPGVYDLELFAAARLRVVVVHELPHEEHNALLHLFSARTEALEYGATHYRPRSSDTSTLLLHLWGQYVEEADSMPEDWKQVAQDTIKSMARKIPAGVLLKGLTPEQRMEGLSPEELRQVMTPGQRLEGLSADELLAALPPDTLAALLQRRQAGPSGAGG